jgi:hypothetical protein
MENRSAHDVGHDEDFKNHSIERRAECQRQLFRGREDVFARLWTNQKKQTTGYAPACANEWVRSVCEKPRIKCGECPNQAFLPVDDKAIQGHLQGQHALGVYPLLRDETCWFLAVDFDGTGWRDDVAAFVATCVSSNVCALHPGAPCASPSSTS